MTEHEHCGCGCEDHAENHVHESHCSCGCEDHVHHTHSEAVTENQAAFLRQLTASKALPVAQFIVTSSKEHSFLSVALAPVFLRTAGDDMDKVKEAGRFLKTLEEQDLIALDYDIPLNGYHYDEYKNSTLYAYFKDTVCQGASRDGFLGDTPGLVLGSMVLTEAGIEAIQEA